MILFVYYSQFFLTLLATGTVILVTLFTAVLPFCNKDAYSNNKTAKPMDPTVARAIQRKTCASKV